MHVPAPPEVAGARVALVFLEDAEGGSAELLDATTPVWAFEVDRWSRLPDEVSVTVAFYAQTEERLGLAMGAVLPAGAAARPCTLLEPLEVRALRIEGGVPSSWSGPLAALPEGLRVFLTGEGSCARPDLCVRFSARVVPLPGSRNLDFVLPLDDTSALVGGAGERFWRVYTDGRFEPLPDMQGLPSHAASRDPDGTIWLAGDHGRVARGRLGGDFEVARVPTSTAALVADIDRDPATGTRLALATRAIPLGEQVILLEQREEGWVVVARYDAPNVSQTQTRLGWVAPGEALITYGGQTLLHYTGGALRERVVGFSHPILDLEVADVDVHPDIGVLFAANDGRLYVGAPPFDTWLALEGAQIRAAAEAIEPFGEGLLFGGQDGMVSQYFPEGAPCPTEQLVASDTEEIELVGGRALVTGGLREEGFDNSVTWLDPLPPD